ncbi:NADPH-dependent diflavin oxidoreductase 1 [Fusarium euwallaceae]|uniref:NADPH-dependent diflavin oxidoreductase 1 n=2 Tax=Fusarium solani species complex TaxID=232080 RepID=A0A430LUG4_9HYPO|nr:NADPH-dependent diflavin oxidoreductase 1 [Fusarium floridanum]RTE79356.1 NADPH-dependent diflavin oxidoreductase 1 [Fusarium euwallaceae]
MAVQDRTVLILYGSETGNAQDMAEELGRVCQRLHFKSRVEELDAVDLNALLQHRFVIFVISTTGQGDMPHNSLLFWKRLLRKKLPPGCLSSVQYTTFGLGDSTYLKFNWAARKLNRRLEQLGATTFIESFEADEQFPDGIDGSFVRWSETLSKHLLEHHPPPFGLKPIPDNVILPPKWSLKSALENSQVVNGHSSPQLSELPPASLLPIPNGWTATLADNVRFTPETHWQDVRLVSFDIPKRDGVKLQCNPGDCLTIYPKNFPQDAQKLITLMGWDDIADKPLDLSLCDSLPQNLYIDPKCTLREIILNNIDFTAIPRRSFLKSMSYFSTNPDHKERLLEFTMTEYLDEYFDYATRSRRSILEVLEEFTSVKLPAERVLDIFPLIRGRDFSIANGGMKLKHPTNEDITRVELLVALVKYRTILRKPRQGLCSRYLENLPAGSSLTVTHKPVLSPIHGPQNAQRPLVAIATGTGLAPIRALIHERLTHPLRAPIHLFFGNRNRDADYFFHDEWDAAVRDGNLDVFLAFSRDQRTKIYVQDRLREEAKRLEGPILDNGIFCVCGGSTKMADAAKRAVFEPFSEGAEDAEGRKKVLSTLTWWQEIW